MEGSSRLFTSGSVHRARVSLCAARAPGVGHFAPAHAVTAAAHCASDREVHTSSCSNPQLALVLEYIQPAPAVTAAPVPVVKYIALAPGRSFWWNTSHLLLRLWRQFQRQWRSSSRQYLPSPWRQLQPCMLRQRLWQSTPHVSCRVINASSNRARNTSASGSAHLAMLVVSVATPPSVFAARALVVEYVAPVPAVAMAPVPTVHASGRVHRTSARRVRSASISSVRQHYLLQ